MVRTREKKYTLFIEEVSVVVQGRREIQCGKLECMVEMVNCTRLDCILGTAALMRQAVAQATHHAAHRQAFGQLLIDQPLMRNVLADLAIEAEAALSLALRLASASDHAAHNEHEALIRRIGTAVGKYWVCKRGPVHVGEALESLGGNGYVEESIMPRLYREVPLNSIWEGSGNVNSLDVLRAMGKEPRVVQAFLAEIALSNGKNAHFDVAANQLKRELANLDSIELRARRVVEQMALLLQGALLLRTGNSAVAEAFCTTRLGGDWGRAFGTLPKSVDMKGIVERALPTLG